MAIKGIRHVNRSASREDTNAEIAPHAYGGAVMSCAVVLVKPTIRIISISEGIQASLMTYCSLGSEAW